MKLNAIGLIEVIGMTAAIEAADTSMKAANVEFIGYDNVQKGLITVKISGDVGAVKAAIEAGKASAEKISTVVSTLVIPRPALQLDGILIRGNSKEDKRNKTTEEISEEKILVEELLSVTEEVEDTKAAFDIEKPSDWVEPTDSPQEPSEGVNKGSEEYVSEEKLPIGDTNLLLSSKGDEFDSNSEPDTELHLESIVESHQEPLSESQTDQQKLCNLCLNSACPREKGQSHSLCIHYKD